MRNIENALDKMQAPLVNIFPQSKADSKDIISTKPKIGLLNLGHPPGRKEIEILSKWVEKKTLECKDDESKQIIYEFALYEIVRQVAVHCNERGVLLKKLFHELKTTHTRSVNKLSNSKIEHQAETKLMLDKKEEVIHNEKIANGHLQEIINFLQKQLQENRKKEMSLELEIDHLRESCIAEAQANKELKTTINRYNNVSLFDPSIKKATSYKLSKKVRNLSIQITPQHAKYNSPPSRKNNKANKQQLLQPNNKTLNASPQSLILINETLEIPQSNLIVPNNIRRCNTEIKKQEKPKLASSLSMDKISQLKAAQKAKEDNRKHIKLAKGKPLHSKNNSQHRDKLYLKKEETPKSKAKDESHNSKGTLSVAFDDMKSKTEQKYKPMYASKAVQIDETNIYAYSPIMERKSAIEMTEKQIKLDLTKSSKDILKKLRTEGTTPDKNGEETDNIISKVNVTTKDLEIIIKEKMKLEKELQQMKTTIAELTEENDKLLSQSDQQASSNPQLNKHSSMESVDDSKMNSLVNESDEDGNELKNIDYSQYSNRFVKEDSTNSKKKNAKTKLRTNAKLYIAKALLVQRKDPELKNRPVLSLKSVLRSIAAIYTDMIQKHKNELKNLKFYYQLRYEFCDYVYLYLIHKYGNQKFAKRKYMELLFSCLKYGKMLRIHLFLGFLGMTDDLESDDSAIYTKIVDYLHKVKTLTVNQADGTDIFYAPINKCKEYIRKYFDANKEELIAKVEKAKKYEQKKDGKQEIDVDLFSAIIIEQRHFNIGKIRDSVHDIFNACDLDHSGYMEFVEFYLIFKYVERKKFNVQLCKQIFGKNHELAMNESNAKTEVLSFNRFADICHTYSLFNEKEQNEFLCINDKGDLSKYASILRPGSDITKLMKERICGFALSSKYFEMVLNTLQEKLSSSNKITRTIVMMYKLAVSLIEDAWIDTQVEALMGDYINLAEYKMTIASLIQMREENKLMFADP